MSVTFNNSVPYTMTASPTNQPTSSSGSPIGAQIDGLIDSLRGQIQQKTQQGTPSFATNDPTSTGQWQGGPVQTGGNPQSQAPQRAYGQNPAPQGAFAQGQAPQGAFAQGQAPQGAFAQGPAPQGAFAQGPAPQGAFAQGQAPQGAFAQGPAPQGAFAQGPAPQGAFAQGPAPQGAFAQGPAPQGAVAQGPASSPDAFVQGPNFASPVFETAPSSLPANHFTSQFSQGTSSENGLGSEVETGLQMLMALLGSDTASAEDKGQIMDFIEELKASIEANGTPEMKEELKNILEGGYAMLSKDNDMSPGDLMNLGDLVFGEPETGISTGTNDELTSFIGPPPILIEGTATTQNDSTANNTQLPESQSSELTLDQIPVSSLLLNPGLDLDLPTPEDA